MQFGIDAIGELVITDEDTGAARTYGLFLPMGAQLVVLVLTFTGAPPSQTLGELVRLACTKAPGDARGFIRDKKRISATEKYLARTAPAQPSSAYSGQVDHLIQ